MPIYTIQATKKNASFSHAITEHYAYLRDKQDAPQFLKDFMRSNLDDSTKKIFAEILYAVMKEAAESEHEKKLVTLLEPEINKENINAVFADEGDKGVIMDLLSRYLKNKKEPYDSTFLNFKKILPFNQSVGALMGLAGGHGFFTIISNVGNLSNKSVTLSYEVLTAPAELNGQDDYKLMAVLKGLEGEGKNEKKKSLLQSKKIEWTFRGKQYNAVIDRNFLIIKKNGELFRSFPVMITTSSISNRFDTTEDDMELSFSVNGTQEHIDAFKEKYAASEVEKPDPPGFFRRMFLRFQDTLRSINYSIKSFFASIGSKIFYNVSEKIVTQKPSEYHPASLHYSGDEKSYTGSEYESVGNRPTSIISPSRSVASVSADEESLGLRLRQSVVSSGSDSEPAGVFEDYNLVDTVADGNCGFNALALRLRDEAKSVANLDAHSLLLKEMADSNKNDREFQKEFGPKVRAYACKAYHAYIEKQSDLNVVKKHHRQLYKYIEDAINKIDFDVSELRKKAALVPDLTAQDKASIDSQVSELLAKKEQLQKDHSSPEHKKTKKIRPPRTPEERLLRAQKRLGRHKMRAQKIIDEVVANPTTWVDDHTLNFAATSLGFSLKIEKQDSPPYELADTKVNQYFKKPEDAPVVHLLNTQGNHWTYLRHQPPLLRAEH